MSSYARLVDGSPTGSSPRKSNINIRFPQRPPDGFPGHSGQESSRAAPEYGGAAPRSGRGSDGSWPGAEQDLHFCSRSTGQHCQGGRRDDEPHYGIQQAKVKVIIQGEQEEQDGDPVLMSRKDLEETIAWETNNLYEYLKGLYAQGLEEAQAGHEFDKEAWEQRMFHLRSLLQQRDSEVEELQCMLGEKEEQLGERDLHILKQADLIRSQAAHIRDLLQQAEHRRTCRRGTISDTVEEDTVRKSPLPHKAALQQTAVYAETHFVQLPPQQSDYRTYKEYESCGLWQAIIDSYLVHKKRWIVGGGMAALLLILIILLATLIPASQGKGGPAFLQSPEVAATGASFFDITVQLDRPAIISYMLFKTSDQAQQVAGTGKTLLELIQGKEVSAAALFDASAASGALQPGGAQPGLQQLASACGWFPVLNGNQNQRVTLASVASAQSAACTSADVPRKCARCPRIAEGTAHTILMVASSPSGDASSEVMVLNSVSQSSAVNINSINPPFADNITSHSFDLHVYLNVPGSVSYAVVHDSIFTQYNNYNLMFESLTPSSSDILFANPAIFTGALVANGSFSVSAANEGVVAHVEPPCVASLCQQSMHGLLGGTSYKVFLVAVDLFGNVDPAPLMVRVTTAPDTSAPTLLPSSGPTSITATSFGFTLSMDAAGRAYFVILALKAVAGVAEPDVGPGNWVSLASLPTNGRRRLLAGVDGPGAAFQQGDGQRHAWHFAQSVEQGISRVSYATGGSRQLLESAARTPGSLVLPTCYPTNLTCQASHTAVFAGVPGLSAFDVVASGCTAAPTAGQDFTLPPTTNLQNNTLYYVLVATEDNHVPSPNRQTTPAIYAVRTVDLSSAQFACGFPTVTNITSSSFAVGVLLTKPAWAFYVVLPTSQASPAPSAADILQGQGAGGQVAAAAGNMTRTGSLPWESGTATDSKKLWASITSLQAGVGYTVFVTLTLDGNTPIPGSPVASVADVFTPATVAPTFTAIKAINTTVDEALGTFSISLNTTLDRPGVVFYALYRAYSCVTGDPSVTDILSGSPLPSSICRCNEPWYCNLVTAGNFSVASSGRATRAALAGGLAPLPFESLRNAPESQLRCFRGGLGQATDTYNIYLMAGSTLSTYTGLATQCSNFAQAAATAAVGGAPPGSCPSSPAFTCSQAQLKPDVRIMQSAPMVTWPQSSNAAGSMVWQPGMGVNVLGRPAKVQLSLEGGVPPAFTFGPDFPGPGQLADGLFVQFKLNKAALVTYAVRYFPDFDPATHEFPTPVLVATGRVPVFEGNTVYNATIKACNGEGWPAGPLLPNTQYSVQYVARDKYGREDGPCPTAHPSCLTTATTLS